MRKCIGSALLVVVLVTVPALAHAQRRGAARPARASKGPSFGLELDWGSQTNFGIGGRGVFNLDQLFPGTPLSGIVSFDYYFPSSSVTGVTPHFWEINGDIVYHFRVPARSSFLPYAGPGLNIAHTYSSVSGAPTSTDVDMNLVLGTTFKVKGNLTPFAEFRGVVGNANQVVLTGGIRF